MIVYICIWLLIGGIHCMNHISYNNVETIHCTYRYLLIMMFDSIDLWLTNAFRVDVCLCVLTYHQFMRLPQSFWVKSNRKLIPAEELMMFPFHIACTFVHVWEIIYGKYRNAREFSKESFVEGWKLFLNCGNSKSLSAFRAGVRNVKRSYCAFQLSICYSRSLSDT